MNKETIKEFLKPDWRRVIIFVTLFGLICIFSFILSYSPLPYNIKLGFPFTFYSHYAPDVLIPEMIEEFQGHFFITFLILDIVVWYIISCLITFIYNKIRSRK